MVRQLVSAVRLIVNAKSIHQRGTGLVQPLNVDYRAFTPELKDDRIQRPNCGNVPEPCGTQVYGNLINHFLEVKFPNKRLCRGKENLPCHMIGSGRIATGFEGSHVKHLTHLVSKKYPA